MRRGVEMDSAISVFDWSHGARSVGLMCVVDVGIVVGWVGWRSLFGGYVLGEGRRVKTRVAVSGGVVQGEQIRGGKRMGFQKRSILSRIED